MSDAFKIAEAQRQDKASAERAEIEARNRAINDLWIELQKIRGELESRGFGIALGCGKFRREEKCVFLFRRGTKDVNAVEFSANSYHAEGGVHEQSTWDAERRKWDAYYFSKQIGKTSGEASVAIARSALDGKLPAFGNVIERGWHTLPEFEAQYEAKIESENRLRKENRLRNLLVLVCIIVAALLVLIALR